MPELQIDKIRKQAELGSLEDAFSGSNTLFLLLNQHNNSKILKLLTLLILCSFGSKLSAADYVGSTKCQQCHGDIANQWQRSDHAKAMMHANNDSVLGDFSNKTITFHNIDNRLFKKEDQFWIETLGKSGKTEQFQISYTFGHYPLQQYLVETEVGRLQALNIAWDSRPLEQGGQRWFHLQPDENITPEHPFFWTNNFQNWNSRCADCHSTHVQKNYDANANLYATTWSELNVACEACHGPGSEHLKLAKYGKVSDTTHGFPTDLRNHSRFVFEDDKSIAVNKGSASPRQLDSCGGCHSRRSIIGEMAPGKDYHQQYQLAWLGNGLYFADGQIDDEVFVLGSFLQSKMYQAGVTCTNCHNAHTTQLKIEGNGLCLQCHKADEYQTQQHHHHPENSDGAQCVECHMPDRTYMQVDDRRDHSFSIPRPVLANEVGASNACQQCHSAWNDKKLNIQYESLFGLESSSKWAEANDQAFKLNILALRDITTLARDKSLPTIRRASLLTQTANYPARLTVETLQELINDKDPMIRIATAEASGFISPQHRLTLLQPLIEDKVKAVRMAAANQLADAFLIAPKHYVPALRDLLNEYETSLRLTEDMPGTQMNLGAYFYKRGNRAAAQKAFKKALIIDPTFVLAMINLADIYRELNDNKESEKLLQRAISIAPDSGAAQHALGLLYVRQQQMEKALVHLELATRGLDANPRYTYVYAVALESLDSKDKAIEVLQASELKWPNQPETLLLLVSYLEQENRPRELLVHLSKLSRIAPANPTVKALIAKHARN